MGTISTVSQARAAQPLGHPLRGALDVRLVLALRADAGDAQQFVEIVQVLVVLLFDVFVQVHAGSSLFTSRRDSKDRAGRKIQRPF